MTSTVAARLPLESKTTRLTCESVMTVSLPVACAAGSVNSHRRVIGACRHSWRDIDAEDRPCVAIGRVTGIIGCEAGVSAEYSGYRGNERVVGGEQAGGRVRT